MNLKPSAGLWSSKNSLLNKLLDTSAKEKQIILVCAIWAYFLWPLMLNLCIVGSSRDYSDLSSLKHRYLTEFLLHCQQYLLFPTKGMGKWSQNPACVSFFRLHLLYPLAWWYFSFCDPDPLCTVEISEFIFVLRELPCCVQETPLTELICFAIWSIYATSRGIFLIDLEHTGGTRCRPAS